jgi:lipopolysaccharide transport system ATP-binding protein
MSDPIISVENLTKRYILGHQRAKEDGIRHVIEDAMRSPMRWLRSRREQKQQEREEFWALRDVSFEVNRGDVVGIVGRNGAGKSTLLKILSRITEPTSGRITLDGRVASLLEVGTGFHPELTGRENIFLNGAILGMSRVEIKRKFDEIVAFSEIERFLDTPVKRYSSGMYVRLAFAVAAHLEPEILIIDEVLAVGDSQFQARCLGKMQEVATSGRTVLFVSHNMAAVKRLCRKGLYLVGGQNRGFRDVDDIVKQYAQDTASTNTILRHSLADVTVRFARSDGSPLKLWALGEEITAEVQVRASRNLPRPAVDLAFYDENGVRVFAMQSDAAEHPEEPPEAKRFTSSFRVRNPGFCAQELTVDVGIRADGGQTHLCWWQRVEVIPVSLKGLSFRAVPNTVVAVPFVADFRIASAPGGAA